MGRKPKADLPSDLTSVLERIGANLREARLGKGITQAALAKLSKISATTINEIETRRFRDIRVSTLLALSSPLDVEVSELLRPSDVKLSSSDRTRLLKASEDIARITKKFDQE